MRRIACAVVAMLAAFAAIGSGVAHADPACTATWTGGGGNATWSTPGNWSGNATPTSSDVACLPAGASVTVDGGNAAAATVLAPGATVTVNGTLNVADASVASAIGTLVLQNGALDGAANVHVTTSLSWTGGWMQGSGATVLDAGANGTIDPNGGAVGLQQRTVSNHGTLTIASGAIGASGGATVTNFAALRLRSENTNWGGVLYDNGGSPKLVNAAGGTLVKDAGIGTTRIQIPVDNEGAVEVQTGRLTLAAGGAPNTTGTWDATASGASLAFDGGSLSLGAGAQLDGAVLVSGGSVSVPDLQLDGALTITGGTLALTSATTASSVGSLTQTGGTLTGAGELDVATALTWSDGTQAGAGSTILTAGATGTLDAPDSGFVRLEQRTLENRGTLTVVHGALRGTQGAVLRNSATLRLNSEATNWGGTLIDGYDGARASFVNTASGTVAKTAGTGSTSIGVPTQDAGTLDAQTGALRFSSNVGATLEDGAVVKGSLQVTGGASVTAGDVDAGAADIAFDNGTIAVADDKTLTVRTFTQSNGQVIGAGRLEIAQALTWTDGTQAGNGTTVVLDGATATLAPTGDSGAVRLEGRTLLNHGTTTVVSGALRGAKGAVLRNTATLRLNSEASYWGGALIDAYDGAHPQLVNTAGGTIAKTAGAGTTGISWPIDQAGTLDAGAGRFQFSDSTNTVTLEAGATVAGTMFVNGGRWSAVGDADASAATFDLAGGTIAVGDGHVLTLGTLTQRGGQVVGAGEMDVVDHLAWSDGSMSGTGSTILLATADGVINPDGESAAVRLEERTLSTRGTLTVSRGAVRGVRGATWRNSGTLTLNSQASYWGGAIIDGTDGARAQLVNTGTLRKTGGNGTSRVTFAIDNEGTADAQSGRLDFGGGGTPNTDGTWSASGGAGSSIDFSDGSFALGAGTQATGAMRVVGSANVNVPDLQLDGDLTITGGTLNVTGTATSHAHSLAQSNGMLGGAGTLALADGLSWTGGQMAGTGTTELATTGTGTIDVAGEAGQVGLDHRTLANAGTLILANGAIRAWGGAVVRNSGTLNTNSQASYWGGAIVDGYNGDTPVLVNTATGTIRKASGTGTTTLSIQTQSTGEVDAATGPIAFPSSGRPVTFGDGSTLRGTLLLNGASVTAGQVDGDDAELRLSGGSLTTTDGDTATIGTLRQTNGWVAGGGALKITDHLQFDGGAMNGTGLTEVVAGAEGTIAPGNDAASVSIEQRELRVSGSLTHVNGTIRMGYGAHLVVPGTLTENSEATYWGGPIADAYNGAHPRLSITPSGKLRKTEGNGNARLQLQTENQGDFEVASPNASLEVAPADAVTEPCDGGRWRVLNGGKEIVISSGLKCLLDGIQLEGRIRVAGSAQVTAGRIDGAAADLAVSSGTLNVTDAAATTVLRSLTMTGGTLTGAAPVRVVDGLTWTGGQMDGTGSTTLAAGSINLVNIPGDSGQVLLDHRTLTNAGTLDLIGGAIRVRNAATIANSGTLRTNSEATYWGGAIVHTEGAPSRLLNTGTLTKSTGTGTTTIGIPWVNDGTVSVAGGRLRWTAGSAAAPSTVIEPPADPSCPVTPLEPSNGTWTTMLGNNASIELAGSCDVLGTGTSLGGLIKVNGASLTLTNPGPSSGYSTLAVDSGSAWVTPGSTLGVDQLQTSGGTLSNEGTIQVSSAWDWSGGRVTGFGTLVVDPGATGEIHPGGCVDVDEQWLVNGGIMTWSQGCVRGGRGTLFVNNGTLRANSEDSVGMTYDPSRGGMSPIMINTGRIEKLVGSGTTRIGYGIGDHGIVDPGVGTVDFTGSFNTRMASEVIGSGSPPTEDPEDVLKPGGNPIGTPSGGGDETIRNVPGGESAAEDLFFRLGENGSENTPQGYPGIAVDLPGGGWIGIRPESKSGDTAIDVNIPSIPEISKIHFGS